MKFKHPWIEIFLVVTLAFMGVAGAQKQASNLKLLRTIIRTQNDGFFLTSAGTQAFLPTTGTCPPSATDGCTLRIEVSAEFEQMGQEGALVTVTVSGSHLPPLDPDPSVLFCSQCSQDSRTFQWMQRKVPAGTQATVSVEFSQGQNQGAASDRTEVIDLFEN
jgi:hypothetical protein